MRIALSIICLLSFELAATLRADPLATTRPTIEKLGTLECDMVEVTPVVFAGRLKLVEYVRENYQHRPPGAPKSSYFRVVDLESGEISEPFAIGQHLCCAMVDGDTLYVFGVDKWGGEKISCFQSTDLKHWQRDVALDLPKWGIFNTSVCKADGRYVMAIEIDHPPEETGVPFTMRFAESKDLKHWNLTPRECVYAKDRYTACPALRFLPDGLFYMVYLEEVQTGYEPYVARSKDLITWERSPLSPMLKPSPDDRKINPHAHFTDAERQRIATAVNINNSDVDFCDFHGEVIISYSWGNQQGIEHFALAKAPGALDAFLQSFFPDSAHHP